MRRFLLPLTVALMLLTLSCATDKSRQEKLDLALQPSSEEEATKRAQEAEEREVKVAIQERLQHIRQLISDGSLDKAQELLSPMEPLEDCRTEVDALQKMIDASRVMVADQAQIALSKQQMEKEAEDKLILPKTYGQIVTVDANLEPIILPPGPMEQMVSKKVSIDNDNLNLKTLVKLLIGEGLNAVADKTLAEHAKVVDVHVKDVPLIELFTFLSRNMGIAFNIGENMVWITKGVEPKENEGSIVLETRTYQLPQGFIPDAPKGVNDGSDGSTGGGSSKVIGGKKRAYADQGGGFFGNLLSGDSSDDDDGTDEASGPNEYTVNGSHDKDLEVALQTALSDSPPGASFRIFPTRNLLLVKDTKENLRKAEKIINDFLKPPAQVVIEARFITVSQNDLKDIGAEITNLNPNYYNNNSNPDKLNKLKKSNIEIANTNFLSTFDLFNPEGIFATNGYGSLTLNGIIGRRNFEILLAALDKKQSTVELSAPKVTVLNNHSARIREGERKYYFEEYDLETIDLGENRGKDSRLVPSGTPAELPLGITLDVNVNVGNDLKTILLGLHPEITEWVKWEVFETGGDGSNGSDSSETGNVRLPNTYERIVNTTVNVRSGETVVLGGMTDNKKQKIVKKIPLLGDIPLIGFLFRHEETTSEPKNLLIFVTATVINERGEYVRATD